MKLKAFITGIGGQDGSFLAERLLQKGFEIHGLVKREAFENFTDKLSNIAHIRDKIHLHVGSASNQFIVNKLIDEIRPDFCYHLAASSFVSYDLAGETAIFENNFYSTLYLLASIKQYCPKCRFYFAGSSEMFGQATDSPQNEETPFRPRSMYGIAKLSSALLGQNYRQQGLFVCNGILYNHESTRRSLAFVTRKISMQVAKIYHGLANELELGNLEAERDWGYAPEYVEAMIEMLEHNEPDDYVVASGSLTSVRQLVDYAFSAVDLDYEQYVKINPDYYRPKEQVPLVGDYRKAKRVLGFNPEKTIEEVMEEMVHYDVANIKSRLVS